MASKCVRPNLGQVRTPNLDVFQRIPTSISYVRSNLIFLGHRLIQWRYLGWAANGQQHHIFPITMLLKNGFFFEPNWHGIEKPHPSDTLFPLTN